MNTAIIIAAHVAIGDNGETYAARLCAELQITEGGITYGDWYLLVRKELNQMYLQKTTIDAKSLANGGDRFGNARIPFYWSSTEHDDSLSAAWARDFSSGNEVPESKGSDYSVRAVRAF